MKLLEGMETFLRLREKEHGKWRRREGLWGKPGALPQKGLGGVNCCPQGRVRLDGALLGRLK